MIIEYIDSMFNLYDSEIKILQWDEKILVVDGIKFKLFETYDNCVSYYEKQGYRF